MSDAPRLNAAELIDHLRLSPHPEGGFYTETYRSPGTSGGRSHSTAIYFLLPKGHVSKLHRLTSDEVWHFHLGGPLCVVELVPGAKPRITTLGPDLRAGQKLQHVVPGGTWFGSYPADGAPYSLVGCTVAPGFEFTDFKMGDRASLLSEFPAASHEVQRLT